MSVPWSLPFLSLGSFSETAELTCKALLLLPAHSHAQYFTSKRNTPLMHNEICDSLWFHILLLNLHMSTWESMCLHLFESSQGHQFIHSFRTATCRTKSTGSLERLFPETCLQRIFFVHRVFFRPLVSFISSHSSAGSIAELTDGPVSSFAFGWPRGWYQLCKGGFRFPAFSDSLSISSNPGKRCRASSTGPLDGACRHMAKSRSGWASRLAKEIKFDHWNWNHCWMHYISLRVCVGLGLAFTDFTYFSKYSLDLHHVAESWGCLRDSFIWYIYDLL